MKIYIDVAQDKETVCKGNDSGKAAPTLLERLNDFLEQHQLKKKQVKTTKYMVIIKDLKTLKQLHKIMGSSIYCVDMRKEAEQHRRRGYMTNGG